MQRYFLKLSYKGTNYKGWQIQPNNKTVQGEINNALTKLNKGKSILSMGCGRTDSGVHATLFYVHFDSNIISDLDNFKYKINNMLPHDIVIHNVIKVNNESHSRYDAVSRTYNYFITTTKDPFIFDTTLFIKQKLDIEIMNKACEELKKYTDFESFSKVKTEVKTFDCTITEAYWKQNNNSLVFEITANRFLRNMVRSIVGTMIDLGLNKITIDDFHAIIKSKNRDNAGKSVLANGLFLTDVKYPYL